MLKRFASQHDLYKFSQSLFDWHDASVWGKNLLSRQGSDLSRKLGKVYVVIVGNRRL